jgi:TatD DNase family protein
MIETDSPWCDIKQTHESSKFLDPKPKLNKKERFRWGEMVKGRNEPCSLYEVLRIVARIKNIEEDILAEQIMKNTKEVFFKDILLV